jgi:2-oxo-4-hydroxy-4-carboxy-5-ureidoimidazoline decarboxylase
MRVAEINAASSTEAAQLFLQCCTSERWIALMVASRPYATAQALRDHADVNWLEMGEEDYLQAFDGHPKIGDVGSLQAKYANTKALAAGEQSGVNLASDEVIQRLAEGNSQYQDKFGFIFIVCASGKSAGEMLALLEARLPNDRDTELLNAAEEQRKIFHIRLNHLLEDAQ